MKTARSLIIIYFMSAMSMVNCQNSSDNNIIARQGNYALTQGHLDKYLEDDGRTLTPDQIKEEKEILIMMFEESPEEILSLIGSVGKLTPPQSQLESARYEPSTVPQPNGNPVSNNLAPGHRQLRSIMGSDIGQMDFNSSKSSAFRTYLYNSLLTDKSGVFSGGSTGTGGRGSNFKMQFCSDGSFVMVVETYVHIDVPGAGASSTDIDKVAGYWDVASLPNGLMFVCMYSTDSYMLEQFPNGLMPLPVIEYNSEYVIASKEGDGFSRSTSYCGQ